MTLFGIIGTSLILISLILQLIDLIRKSNAKASLKFLLMNVFGSLFILLHTLIIKDLILIIFNFSALFIGLFSLIYALKNKKYF
ncbi:MAG: hypothetical protein QXR30_00775 [Candidatus Woesearchaeota archaeon]